MDSTGSKPATFGKESANIRQVPTPSISPPSSPPLTVSETQKGSCRSDLEDNTGIDTLTDTTDLNGLAHQLDGTTSGLRDNVDLFGAEIKKETSKVESGQKSNGAGGKTAAERPRSPSVLKLSSRQIHELTSSPFSLPVRSASPQPPRGPLTASLDRTREEWIGENTDWEEDARGRKLEINGSGWQNEGAEKDGSGKPMNGLTNGASPGRLSRTVSTPPLVGRKKASSSRAGGWEGNQSRRGSQAPALAHSGKEKKNLGNSSSTVKGNSSNIQSSIPSVPLPPLSIPTYLQLELATERPSPLYIQRSTHADIPFESSAVKFDRLRNFLLLPPQLEHVLWFGTVACIDAWLHTFTILPLRFLKAFSLLASWWLQNAWKEVYDLVEFVYLGVGRLWRRSREDSIDSNEKPSRLPSHSRRPSRSNGTMDAQVRSKERSGTGESNTVVRPWSDQKRSSKGGPHRHKRTRSKPSLLRPGHKADLLKGLLVIMTSIVLMKMDPSRMYHNIRGQDAVKLYVIYNALEVGDRLLSAIGQDILECLFSEDTLSRNPDGRSKVIRPLWMFLISLVYNILHAACLLYQVITLNVAVNSYSNALLTLLMSNQFVEIKGAVWKKIEKENLFQLTCADVVERFQLLLMLLIIAMRNIVEVGGLSISTSSSFNTSTFPPSKPSTGSNTTGTPISSGGGILPTAFTLLPRLNGQVLGPFLLVIGSEIVVDWIKHAYIIKFNSVKPALYGRFLDVLARDYYTHAFADQNLMKRIGLPVLPLACLFVRAITQSYHLFLATHMPLPLPSSGTSLALDEDDPTASTPASTAALVHVDRLFRRALGRAHFDSLTTPPTGASASGSSLTFLLPTSFVLDDMLALLLLAAMLVASFLLLLALKLLLGMLLLQWSRARYRGMDARRSAASDAGARRLGCAGSVEVSAETRAWIYEGDEQGRRRVEERENKDRYYREREGGLGGVRRFGMVGKRIW